MNIGVQVLLSLLLVTAHTQALTLDELLAAGGHVGCFPASSLDDGSARAAALAVATEAAGVGSTSLVGREVEVATDEDDSGHETMTATTVVPASSLASMSILAEGRIGSDYCVSAITGN